MSRKQFRMYRKDSEEHLGYGIRSHQYLIDLCSNANVKLLKQHIMVKLIFSIDSNLLQPTTCKVYY